MVVLFALITANFSKMGFVSRNYSSGKIYIYKLLEYFNDIYF